MRNRSADWAGLRIRTDQAAVGKERHLRFAAKMLNAENDSYDAFMTVKRVVDGTADYVRINTQTVSARESDMARFTTINFAARAYT